MSSRDRSPPTAAEVSCYAPKNRSTLALRVRGRRSSCPRQALPPGEPRLHSHHRRLRRHRRMECPSPRPKCIILRPPDGPEKPNLRNNGGKEVTCPDHVKIITLTFLSACYALRILVFATTN